MLNLLTIVDMNQGGSSNDPMREHLCEVNINETLVALWHV